MTCKYILIPLVALVFFMSSDLFATGLSVSANSYPLRVDLSEKRASQSYGTSDSSCVGELLTMLVFSNAFSPLSIDPEQIVNIKRTGNHMFSFDLLGEDITYQGLIRAKTWEDPRVKRTTCMIHHFGFRAIQIMGYFFAIEEGPLEPLSTFILDSVEATVLEIQDSEGNPVFEGTISLPPLQEYGSTGIES